ncbi:MAG: FIG00952634: hypothetical protein [uncultured Thiotrichaceae bacterium]|uniref:non-specific serine/threonine protein kinase n=1 Tax=uncultured Thiotrichaceae bacterium TaxID=298394 RepID=A0A6S6SZT9_9GAMM|nr:MAG: FIG00952634: hypothetical protein [uncultured Thiotrichaceae bacterium]
MKIPKRIQSLVEYGLVDEVISRMMSGKEADVYVVGSGSEILCAKVYKEASKRNFKKAVQYTEGRKVRNSRRNRAIQKGSNFGRKEQEEIWQNAEVDALYKLAAAGVRVPKPSTCVDGVLLMELVTDGEGQIAPRLGDVSMTRDEAMLYHAMVIQDVVRMLCVGVVHGDLSEFNVLLDQFGPVIIDLPQAVDAAANNNAEAMLQRDVENMRHYFGQFAPELLATQYDKEMWELFELGTLHPESMLTGEYQDKTKKADVGAVKAQIKAAYDEEQARLERLKESGV